MEVLMKNLWSLYGNYDRREQKIDFDSLKIDISFNSFVKINGDPFNMQEWNEAPRRDQNVQNKSKKVFDFWKVYFG